MLIQLIIFLTKTKIFASEINSNGKAETISIKGNTEIKCEGKESVDELLECLYDAFNIDNFADDNFDIIILEAGADREIINCLQEECKDAAKLNTISVEKLLPVIVSNKNMVKSGEEISVTFADMFYKIACDENGIIKVVKARKSEEAILISDNDFACLYRFEASGVTSVVDENKLEEAREEIAALQRKLNSYKTEMEELHNMNEDYKKEFTRLNQIIIELQSELKKAKGPTENEVFRKRLEIVKKYEKQIVVESNGCFYTRGGIPKKSLEEALEIINEPEIKKDNIIALYCGQRFDEAASILIFTSDYLYYGLGKSDCFAYESVNRIEQLTMNLSTQSMKLNAAKIILQNGTVVFLGNKVAHNNRFLGKYVPGEWGLRIDILIRLLQELGVIFEEV